jgi:DNA polymerase-3 subunit delta
MNITAFKKWLKDAEKKNLILVNGEEDYFKVKVKEHILKAHDNAEYFSFTQDELNVEKAKSIILDSETMPFFGGDKVFYLRDVDKLHKSVIELFNDYFNNLPETSVFILSSTKLDGRSSFYKKLVKKGAALKATPLYDNKCGEWIRQFADNLGKKLERDAENLILELVGTSLIGLENELIKIANYVKDRKTIANEDILAVTNSIKANTVFDLADAIGSGDKVRALFLLNKIRDQGVHEIMALVMISRHFRYILRIQELKREGCGDREIASKLKINPYFLTGYVAQANKIKPDRALNFYNEVIKTDLKLKSMNWDSQQIAERLILSF